MTCADYIIIQSILHDQKLALEWYAIDKIVFDAWIETRDQPTKSWRLYMAWTLATYNKLTIRRKFVRKTLRHDHDWLETFFHIITPKRAVVGGRFTQNGERNVLLNLKVIHGEVSK